MSLLQLLTTGQSFCGFKKATSPYRLVKQDWFPKFLSNAAAPTETKALIQSTPEVKELSVASSVQSLPAISWPEAPSASGPALKPSAARKAGVARFLPSRPPAKSGGALRQGELMLDMVKVVRNDLSESDLEVVPQRQTAPPGNLSPEESDAVRARRIGLARFLDRFFSHQTELR